MRARTRDWDLFYAAGLLATAFALAGCGIPDPPEPSARTSVESPFVAHDPMPAPSVQVAAVEPEKPAEPVDAATARSAWSEGVGLFDRRDYAAASERLGVAAAGRTEDAYTHYLHGLALWKSGRTTDAVTALERSAALDGGSLRTWVNLARVRLDQEDATAALGAAERALALDASSADAMHQGGRALAKLGRTAEALDLLARAHAAAPENGFVANTLGLLLLQSGQAEEAVPLLEGARDQLPGVAYVRNNLAVAYERTGQDELALAEYRAAVGAGDSGGKATASLARLGAPLLQETPAVETAMGEPQVAASLPNGTN